MSTSRPFRACGARLARFAVLATTCLAPAPAAHAQGAPPTAWIAGGHSGLNALALSPDGSLLATGSEQDNTAKLYNAATGEFLRTFTAHFAGVEAVAFAPGGAQLATGGQYLFGGNDVQVKLWDVATATVIRTFGTSSQTAWSLAFSPDGTQLASGEGTQIKIYNVSTGALLRTLSGHTWYVFGLAYSPDGASLASASGDRTVKLWRVSDGALRRTLTGHTGFVHGVAWSPGGVNVASASWDGTGRIWQVSTGALLHTLTGHTDAVQGVAYAPDGVTLATCAGDNTVKIWNAATGAVVRTIAPGGSPLFNALAYGPGGATLYTTSFDGHPRAFDPATGALVRLYGQHTAGVTGLAFVPDGSGVVTGSRDLTARRFAAATGAEAMQYLGHADVINAVSVAPDLQQLATAAGSPPPDTRDSSIKVWNLASGALIRTLSGHFGGSFAVAHSPDGQYIGSGGNDGTARLWRTSDGVVARVFSEGNAVHAVAFSPDSTRFAAAGNAAFIHIYRVSDGALLRSISSPAQVTGLAFSPHSDLLAAGVSLYGDNIALYDPATGALVRSLAGHTNWTQSVAFSPDGQQLLSGGAYDYEVKLWRVADGALQAQYDHEAGWGLFPALPVAFAPSGQQFAYGRNDGPVVLATNAFVTAVPAPAGRPAAPALIVRRRGAASFAITLPPGAGTTLDLFDIRGARVARLWHGSPASLAWSLTVGQPLAPGVYVAALTGGGAVVARTRLVVTH